MIESLFISRDLLDDCQVDVLGYLLRPWEHPTVFETEACCPDCGCTCRHCCCDDCDSDGAENCRCDCGVCHSETETVKPTIPAHWLRLAGELLSETSDSGSCDINTGAIWTVPAEWSAEEMSDFRTSIIDWLNEPIEALADTYDYDVDLQYWMAMEFLGALLQDTGDDPAVSSAFATSTLLVTPC